MIVHAAKISGIVTAPERPKTNSMIRSAIGIAIRNSPFFRSSLKIGSRSCWIAACPVTYGVTPSPRGSSRRTLFV